MLKFLLIFGGAWIFSSCSQPNSQSLLSKASLNSCIIDPTQAACSGSGSSTTGALEIFTTQSTKTAAINNSDTVEITGTCVDQGKFNNRIIVQVFADEDENQTPYINNENNLFCQSSSNPVQSGLESNNSDQCIYVTQGMGVVEGAGISQTIYPQCFNGQYGFSVRLGKVLADSGKPYKKYLVRFKLRAIEPTPALPTDSEWMRVSIDRPLEKPSISAVPEQGINSAHGCRVNAKASRTNFSILNSLTRTFTNPVNGLVVGPTSVYTNISSNYTVEPVSIYDYKDYLPEGLTYSYQLTTTESQFSYTGGNTPTEISQVVKCALQKPTITMTTSATANTCYFGVASPNVSPNVIYEFGYRQDDVGWPINNPNGYFINANCGSGSPVCTMTGLAAASYYHVAVRAKNNVLGIVGGWSPAITCRTP